jgi:hypothetical protein
MGETRISETRLAEFREAYLTNDLNAYRACIAIGFTKGSAKRHAYRYARAVKLEIREGLEARGYGAAKIVELFIKLLNSNNERIRLDALKEVLAILNAYPRDGEQAVPPVTLIFRTDNLIQPGEEPDYHNTARQIDQASDAAEVNARDTEIPDLE